MMLAMQSVTGEIPYGGRSNQFLHNEAHEALLFEYLANQCAREGDLSGAASYKAAILRAVENIEYWLSKTPIRHIKSRYPIETRYGCEKYAYFDKYMITTASFLYVAYLICDDTLAWEPQADLSTVAFATSRHFHKLFLKSGGYALEIDYDADPKYECKGLGRVHRSGAPSTVCISTGCSAAPCYGVESPGHALSLCPGILRDGEYQFAIHDEATYRVCDYGTDDAGVYGALACDFAAGGTVESFYRVNGEGVKLRAAGEGELAYLLPAFSFDGEAHTRVLAEEHRLTLSYEGWSCIYETDGKILDTDTVACNRNGVYRRFMVVGADAISVHIRIEKI